MKLKIGELARRSGLTVRTLHHYDDIGLLKPAVVGANGYRYYGREELLRLQEILFHREIGMSLTEIALILDAPGFDRRRSLQAHRTRLAAQAQRARILIRTIDQTLDALNGDRPMDEKAMYRGFDPARQAAYEAELVRDHGPAMADHIRTANEGMGAWRQTDFDAMQAEAEAIEAAMARALTDGLPTTATAVAALMARHHAWVSRSWSRSAPAAAFAGLGRMYVEHPDFRARYDGRAQGLAEYMAAAMEAYARSALPPADHGG